MRLRLKIEYDNRGNIERSTVTEEVVEANDEHNNKREKRKMQPSWIQAIICWQYHVNTFGGFTGP